MSSSSVRTFTDPDEFAAAIRQGTLHHTITSRGQFAAKLTRIDLHDPRMQRFSETLPRVAQIDGRGGGAIVSFRTRSGPSPVRCGVEMESTGVLRAPPGQNYYQTTTRLPPGRWRKAWSHCRWICSPC
jgi:hypothetical protein